MEAKGFAMSSSQSLILLCTINGSHFLLSRMGNKIIYQLNDLIKKTSWKSSRLSVCSNFALFCCQVSNSGVIFRKYINAVYVIFFFYREGWYVMSKNFWKSVCVYTYKKGFPFKRLWDYKNTFYCQREFYYR